MRRDRKVVAGLSLAGHQWHAANVEIRIDSLLRGAQTAEGTVVIVDVFRAFTACAVALARGAERIILEPDVERALALRQRGVGHQCFGEVGGKPPPGFDFGNSPFELSQVDVRGRTLIQSTRAGTVGAMAARTAQHLYAAAFVNASATAAALVNAQPAVVTIVAMGAEGRVRTDEDELCALYLRNVCEGRHPDPDAVRRLVLASKEAQKFGDPARPYLHAEDREIALQIDSLPIVIQVTQEQDLLVARRAVTR
jgi:2-phosphosulfolactate phosphatase